MTDKTIKGFPIIPANKMSVAKRQPMFGVGINDAPYMTHPTINGKMKVCPFYSVWKSMIVRCYDPKTQARRPTYIGCTVATAWLSFVAFREWMIEQDWQGNHLDKDILHPGNKVYGPDFCVFVDQATNNLLTDCGAARGKWPVGVYFNKNDNKYKASCGVAGGKREHLGYFDTPKKAHTAYIDFKAGQITNCANRQPDLRVRDALLISAIGLGGS